jgi:imidazolonepropionase-like amidohydrolase
MTIKNFTNHISVLSILICFLLLLSTGYSQTLTQTLTQIVIKNVNVITMTSPNNIINNATVVITNNRIKNINGDVPENATIIDGKGKWLIPGLIDMHVHLSTDTYFGLKLRF